MGALLIMSFTQPAHASRSTYHLANPFGWSHLMPTGETPGWSDDNWFNLEVSQSNLWNSETTVLKNKRNGEIITFLADFEQTSAVAEIGHAFGKRFAASLLVPYAHRGGGFLDGFIDDFHVAVGSHRFARQFYKHDRSAYRITSGGETRLDQSSGGDVGNLKLKLKYWMWQLQSDKRAGCDCGLSFGLHTKAPIGLLKTGFTSGEWDFSGTIHLALPLWKDSGIYTTAGFTYISPNELTKNWPMRNWQQMYELSLDLGLGGGWGLALTGRMESPWMNVGDLEFQSNYEDPEYAISERESSGWNGLVYWRGSQSAGIRYRANGGTDFGVHIVEDWALGNYDKNGDDLYVNNAPDVSFVLKLNTSF